MMLPKLLSLSIAVVLSLGSICAVNAQQIATPVNGDTRLVTFDYDPDVTYLILTRPKAVTHVMLAPGEQVQSLVAGDTVNFVFQVSASREHIFIKPKFEGMTTSASLVTSRGTYQFILRSANDSGKWHQRVSWNNPDMVLQDVSGTRSPPVEQSRAAPTAGPARLSQQTVRDVAGDSALAIEKLNFDYSITGDSAVRPAQAFDDGVRTFFRVPPSMQELPALFAVKDKEASLVNYSVKDGYLVAQGVGGTFLLKLGKLEAKVEKNSGRSFFGSFRNE